MHHHAQRSAQALILFPSEKIRSAEFTAKLPGDGHRLIIVNAPGFLRFQAGDGNPLVIVIIQQIEGEGILRHHLEESPGLVRRHVVPLQNLPDQRQRLLELFQAFCIYGISLDQMIPQHLGCPDAELRAAFGIYPVTYGDNHVEVVKFHPAPDTAAAFPLNYREILGSCRIFQFTFLVDVSNM